MGKIVGGILIAFLIIVTFPIWGNLLLLLLGVVIANWKIFLGIFVVLLAIPILQAAFSKTQRPSKMYFGTKPAVGKIAQDQMKQRYRASVITATKMGNRDGLRDVGKNLGLSDRECDEVERRYAEEVAHTSVQSDARKAKGT